MSNSVHVKERVWRKLRDRNNETNESLFIFVVAVGAGAAFQIFQNYVQNVLNKMPISLPDITYFTTPGIPFLELSDS